MFVTRTCFRGGVPQYNNAAYSKHQEEEETPLNKKHILTKIYDKRDDFDFDFVNFPFLDGDVPRRPSYGVYISQFIRVARASSHVTDFNYRNKFLTAKLLKPGYRYHKLRKALSKFYRRHFELIEKYHVSLKKLMQQGIYNPEFYGHLVYTFNK